MKIILPDNLPKKVYSNLYEIFSSGEHYGKVFRALAETEYCYAGDLFIIVENGCIQVYNDGSQRVYVNGDDWCCSDGASVYVEPVAVNCVLDFQSL